MKEEIFDWEIHGIPRPEIITIRTRCGRWFGEQIMGGDSLQREMLYMQSPVWLGKSAPWNHQYSKHHQHPHPILLGPVGGPEALAAQCPWWLNMLGVCGESSAHRCASVSCVSMAMKAVIVLGKMDVLYD